MVVSETQTIEPTANAHIGKRTHVIARKALKSSVFAFEKDCPTEASTLSSASRTLGISQNRQFVIVMPAGSAKTSNTNMRTILAMCVGVQKKAPLGPRQDKACRERYWYERKTAMMQTIITGTIARRHGVERHLARAKASRGFQLAFISCPPTLRAQICRSVLETLPITKVRRI